jgi:hypothetical protein
MNGDYFPELKKKTPLANNNSKPTKQGKNS